MGNNTPRTIFIRCARHMGAFDANEAWLKKEKKKERRKNTEITTGVTDSSLMTWQCCSLLSKYQLRRSHDTPLICWLYIQVYQFQTWKKRRIIFFQAPSMGCCVCGAAALPKKNCLDNAPRVNLHLCLLFIYFFLPFLFLIRAHVFGTFEDITFGYGNFVLWYALLFGANCFLCVNNQADN